jgi:hypothetical protein
MHARAVGGDRVSSVLPRAPASSPTASLPEGAISSSLPGEQMACSLSQKISLLHKLGL